MLPRLISYKLCPFVQRSVIVLLEKNIAYNIVYIDLDKKPDWFLKLCPTAKIPILQIEDQVVFESSVINEYLDEANPPSLQPSDLLIKATNKAWAEFASKLFMEQHALLSAKDEKEFVQKKEQLKQSLRILERNIKHKPFFNGKDFALVDAAFAPFFVRNKYLTELLPLELYPVKSRIAVWANNLLNRFSVQHSVVPDFADLFKQRLKSKESFIWQQSSNN